MTTFTFSLAALLALAPAGFLLYLVLDPYSEPKVSESVFEERKALMAFVGGIPAGIPLAIIFLLYADSLETLSLGSAVLYLALFVVVAALERSVFLRLKTFGGRDGRDRRSPFYTFAFGGGNAVAILLAAALSAFAQGPLGAYEVLLVLGLSIDLALVEGWAGLRMGRYHRTHPSFLPAPPVLAFEALALVLLAPLYLGFIYVREALLLAILVLFAVLVRREDRLALRPVGDLPTPGDQERRFGRRLPGAPPPGSPPPGGEPEDRGSPP